MARFRSVFALSALALAASALAACTPAVSSSAPRDPFASPIVPGQSARASAGGGRATIDAPSPRSGSGTVTVALVGGAQLPTETAQAFTEATGFTVAVVSIDGVGSLPKTSADVVLGLDGADAVAASAAGTIASTAPRDTSTLAGTAVEGAAAAIAYGRDDVCVIADKSWLSANGRSLPTSFADLTSPRVRSLLALPDPTSSSVGRAFVQEAAAQTGEGLGAFAQSLSPRIDPSLGAAVGVWTAGGHVSQGYVGQLVGGEAEASGAYPLVVAPRSLAAAAATNTGADSYGAPVSSTCIARILYAAPTASPASDGAESLIAWLQGERAQRLLATAGSAYPIDGGVAADTKAAWLMGISGDAVVPDETVASPEAINAWLATWNSALSAPASTQPEGEDGDEPAAPSPAPVVTRPSAPDPGTDTEDED